MAKKKAWTPPPQQPCGSGLPDSAEHCWTPVVVGSDDYVGPVQCPACESKQGWVDDL